MPPNGPECSAGFPHVVPGNHGGTGDQSGCYGDGMRADVPRRLSIAMLGLCLAAGLATLLVGSIDPGIRIGTLQDGRIGIVDVTPGGLAAASGLREGRLVAALNGTELIAFPDWRFPMDLGDGAPRPGGVLIGEPTFVDLSNEALEALLSERVREIVTLTPAALETGSLTAGFEAQYVWLDPYGLLGEATRSLLYGVVLLVLGMWFLGTGRAGASLRPIAIPLSLAIAAPFLLQPLLATWAPLAVAVRGLLLPAAMVPLAMALRSFIEDARDRQVVDLILAGAGALAVGAALAVVVNPVDSRLPDPLHWSLVGAIPLVPGLWAAGPSRSAGSPASPSGRVVRSTAYALAGATPLFALASATDALAVPLSLWLLVIFVSSRLSIRPLARLATRVQLQRDLVVAATEAERARVAADIHDDALQELTLLVRRLDAAGDAEGAEIARHVADRLRAICGDLRLPILDDLGVGPALDWLVVRIERLAGGEVRLERHDGTRPPPDVELAFFRVAQEALANAVKHGRPPIVVRYAATPAGASLSVDDAGPGITSDAGVAAEQAGRFGLLNMAQRAEQIGAILDVRAWPGGGTHVALEWRPG